MDITIEEQVPSVPEYQKLRSSAQWDKLEDAVVEKGLKNSLFAVSAYFNESIAGTGRVVGDGALYYYIQDVIVLPEFQGKGIGTKIMVEIENYLKANAAQNSFVGLMAAKGVETFYMKFGYEPRPGSRPGMFKVMNII